MSTRFETYKVITGSSVNTHVLEHPVRGSNGTAVITRINNFIDVVGKTFDNFLPTTSGGLATVDTNGGAQTLLPGPNGYCLVSDTSSGIGLAYKERVDLSTNQVIGGIKTFSARTLFTQGGISDDVFDFKSDINVEDTTSTNNLIVNNQTSLKGNTIQYGVFTVKGSSIFEMNSSFMKDINVLGKGSVGGDLTVAGDGSYTGDLSIGGDNNTTGSLYIGDVLSVTGTITGNQDLYIKRNASLDGDVNIGEDLVIAGSVNSGGNFTVTGYIQSGNYLKASSLLIDNTASIQGKVTIEEDIVVERDAFIGRDLTVNGVSNLDDINLAGDLLISGGLSVSSPSIFKDTIQGFSLHLSNNLSSNGNTDLNVVEVEELTNKGSLIVKGVSYLEDSNIKTLYVREDLGIMNTLSVQGLTKLDSLVVTRNGSVGGNLTIEGYVVSNTLSTNSIVVEDRLTVNGSQNSIRNLEVKDSFIVNSSSSPAIFYTDLQIQGEILAENLRGINTGDETIATPSVRGLVKITNANDNDPRVYTKGDVDYLFINKEELGRSVTPLSNGKINPVYLPDNLSAQIYESPFEATDIVDDVIIINHGLNKRYPSSITIWNNLSEKVYPSLIQSISNDEILINFMGLVIEGTWFISISK